MAADQTPVALIARRSPTATRRGLAVTVPVSNSSVGARFTESFPGERHIERLQSPTAIVAPPPPPARPWALPARGLSLFYGRPETPRLFHYFLPRLLAEGKQVLCLDGANRFDPLLIARLARQRGIAPSDFNRAIRVARAFTCFQLTELLVRVPRLLQNFAADALIVTALPDLYFDQDILERDAVVTFTHALNALRALTPLPLSVAVFSDATSFETSSRAGLHVQPAGKKPGLYLEPARKNMFARLAAQSTALWRFTQDAMTGRLRLMGEEREAALLSAGNRA